MGLDMCIHMHLFQLTSISHNSGFFRNQNVCNAKNRCISSNPGLDWKPLTCSIPSRTSRYLWIDKRASLLPILNFVLVAFIGNEGTIKAKLDRKSLLTFIQIWNEIYPIFGFTWYSSWRPVRNPPDSLLLVYSVPWESIWRYPVQFTRLFLRGHPKKSWVSYL